MLKPFCSKQAAELERVGLRGRYKVALGDQLLELHTDRLKMYLPHVNGSKIVLNYYRPHREVPEDDSMIVEKILKHRIRDGQYQWYVRWKGYDDAHNTWEPLSSFVGYVQQDWADYNRRHHLPISLKKLQ